MNGKRFDIIVSYDAADRHALLGQIREQVQEAFPGYTLQIIMDTDFSKE